MRGGPAAHVGKACIITRGCRASTRSSKQSRWEEELIVAEFHRHMREAYATLARVARERRVSSVV